MTHTAFGHPQPTARPDKRPRPEASRRQVSRGRGRELAAVDQREVGLAHHDEGPQPTGTRDQDDPLTSGALPHDRLRPPRHPAGRASSPGVQCRMLPRSCGDRAPHRRRGACPSGRGEVRGRVPVLCQRDQRGNGWVPNTGDQSFDGRGDGGSGVRARRHAARRHRAMSNKGGVPRPPPRDGAIPRGRWVPTALAPGESSWRLT